MTTKIDITPTWRGAASVYLAVLESGTPEGQAEAREAILEMAERFDTYIQQMAEQNEMAQNLIPSPEQDAQP